MNKWVRIGAISAISLGIFAFGYSQQHTKVSAAEQFYSVPNTNTNIQQETNTSNAMASYSDSSIQNVATTAPKVTVPAKYVHTKLDMNVQNKADSYTSQDGSTTFNTYYYLPEGFHVKDTEHGNYQSSVQVGDNIYVVESMGTGTNQGAIVRYNINDLKQMGVLSDNGNGIDLVWKALKYISPYTKSGNNHSSLYANYQSYLDDANSNLKSTQNQVQNAKDQMASDQQEVDDYQKQVNNDAKLANKQIKKIQTQINNAYKIDKKTDKSTPKPVKLTLDNFVTTLQTANSAYDERLNKLIAKEQQVLQSMSDLKAAYKGKTPKKITLKTETDVNSNSSSSADDSDLTADSSADDTAASAANAANASSAASSSDDNSSADSSNSSNVASDSSTSSSDSSSTDTKTKLKKISKDEYVKKLAPLTKKLAKLTAQKTAIKNKKATNNSYIDQFKNGFAKNWITNTQNVKDANDLVSQDQQAVDDANQAVVDAQKAIDQLSQNQVDFAKYSEIAHAAQISPLINIGHGQTLSYNPATKNLYLAQDETSGDLAMNGSNVITELDSNTLQPIKQFNFQMLHNNSNYALHTLTFDNDGNAYFGRKSGKKYQIFKGQLNETTGQVSFAPVQQTINWGGTHNQGLSYNPVNNRLYIVSDDIITSVPADKLGAGTVQPSDVNYISFNTGREFEDLTFDSQGYGYLLMLWKPEILKTTTPIK